MGSLLARAYKRILRGKLAQDEGEHWVTVNAGSKEGGEGGGSHVLLDGEGRVVAGMGGKFKGQNIDRIERKKFINQNAWNRQRKALIEKAGDDTQLKRVVTAGMRSQAEKEADKSNDTWQKEGLYNALVRRTQRENKGMINVLHDHLDHKNAQPKAVNPIAEKIQKQSDGIKQIVTEAITKYNDLEAVNQLNSVPDGVNVVTEKGQFFKTGDLWSSPDGKKTLENDQMFRLLKKELKAKQEAPKTDRKSLIDQVNARHTMPMGDIIARKEQAITDKINNSNLSEEDKKKYLDKLNSLTDEALKAGAGSLDLYKVGVSYKKTNAETNAFNKMFSKQGEIDNLEKEINKKVQDNVTQAENKLTSNSLNEAERTGAVYFMDPNGKEFYRAHSKSKTWYQINQYNQAKGEKAKAKQEALNAKKQPTAIASVKSSEDIANSVKESLNGAMLKKLKSVTTLRTELDKLPNGTFISHGNYTFEKVPNGWKNGDFVLDRIDGTEIEKFFDNGNLKLGIGKTPEEAKNSIKTSQIFEVKPQQETAPKVEEPKDYSRPITHEDGHISAHTGEINEQLAKRAYYWTSHDPEGRGKRVMEEYAQEANNLYDRLKEQVKTPEQQAFLNEAFETAKKKLADAYNNALSAESRTASSMITGPARFNVRQQEQRRNTAEARWKEAWALTDKLEESISKGIYNRNTAEEKQRLNDEPYLEKIKGIKYSMENGNSYSAALMKSELYKSLEAKARAGKVEELGRLMQAVKDAGIYTNRHSVWQLPAIAQQRAEKNATNATRNANTYKGVNIERNTDINRLQLKFDERPTPEQVNDLKHSGWRWSPHYQAWQRQITDNAERSMSNFLDKHFKKEEPQAVAPKAEDQPRTMKNVFSDKYQKIDNSSLNEYQKVDNISNNKNTKNGVTNMNTNQESQATAETKTTGMSIKDYEGKANINPRVATYIEDMGLKLSKDQYDKIATDYPPGNRSGGALALAGRDMRALQAFTKEYAKEISNTIADQETAFKNVEGKHDFKGGSITINKGDYLGTTQQASISFAGKPSEETRALLKKNGFTYYPRSKTWENTEKLGSNKHEKLLQALRDGVTIETTQQATPTAQPSQATATPQAEGKQYHGTGIENKNGRFEISFNDFPSYKLRTDMKNNGFRWDPNAKVWHTTDREKLDQVLSKHFSERDAGESPTQA